MDFRFATHTLIVSDLHLTEAEPPHPVHPLWKRYKHRDLFVDDSFARLLTWWSAQIGGPAGAEVVLNGDIFDFDAVTSLPDDERFPASWFERARGLEAEEQKSVYKIKQILNDHPTFLAALRGWVVAGGRLVTVIGNHDLELHWDSVQSAIVDALDLSPDGRSRVRFCEWFYRSNEDTLIEHGNQFDSYCLCTDPVHPLVHGDRLRVRLPFGNLAARFIVNGMGLINPHAEANWVMSFSEYVDFFYKYVARIQPLVVWTWLWGAVATFVFTLRDGLAPAVRDPFTIGERIDDIALRANADARMVWSLRAIHAHPAIFDPIKVLRELWLDRVVLLLAIAYVSSWISAIGQWITGPTIWFFVLAVALGLPPFIFYARSIDSDVNNVDRTVRQRLGTLARIARVDRVVMGHTHRERHTAHDGVELLNPGTWSPAFRDPECQVPYGRKCFVWIRPGDDSERVAEVHHWQDPGSVALDVEAPTGSMLRRLVRRLALG